MRFNYDVLNEEIPRKLLNRLALPVVMKETYRQNGEYGKIEALTQATLTRNIEIRLMLVGYIREHGNPVDGVISEVDEFLADIAEKFRKANGLLEGNDDAERASCFLQRYFKEASIHDGS